MNEEWKNVTGYEGLYQVSNLGRVKSLARVVPYKNGRHRPIKSRVLRPGKNKVKNRVKGLRVVLHKDGVRTTFSVHRLVLGAWIGPCPIGSECCHNDGDPTNNVVSNLRWDSSKNNTLDALRHGVICAFPTRSVIRSDGVKFDSLSEAAHQSGCHRQNIGACCLGKLNNTGGYGWKYAKAE